MIIPEQLRGIRGRTGASATTIEQHRDGRNGQSLDKQASIAANAAKDGRTTPELGKV